jgi:hypothetical protein
MYEEPVLGRWGRITWPPDDRDCFVKIELWNGESWLRPSLREQLPDVPPQRYCIIVRRVGRPDRIDYSRSTDDVVSKWKIDWLEPGLEPPSAHT